MSKHDGGPAYPATEWSSNGDPNCPAYPNWNYPGMSLRDRFALEAMQFYVGRKISENVAKKCYEMADAMLAERSKSDEA